MFFKKAPLEDMKITKKESVRVYYRYKPGKAYPFKLYESDLPAFGWVYVDKYKTLNEAQESGLSRAIHVKELGIYEGNQKKGMMSWVEQPVVKLPPVVPAASANFDYSPDVEFQRLRSAKRKSLPVQPEQKSATILHAKSAFSLQK